MHMIWPEHCPVCGRPAVSFCPECLASCVLPLPPFCIECGGKYDGSCCVSSSPAYALSMHGGNSREFLLDLKYRNARSLGMPMGRLMADNAQYINADLLVPIPLHKGSKREYNQTELLAQGISERWNIPVASDALFWKEEFKRQTEKNGHSRMMLPCDSISLTEMKRGTKIILIDDVYTTGATLRAAKFAAEKSGAVVAGAMLWSRRLLTEENPISWKNTEE